jgi:thiol-disulfide isomerase/thioredoxin
MEFNSQNFLFLLVMLVGNLFSPSDAFIESLSEHSHRTMLQEGAVADAPLEKEGEETNKRRYLPKPILFPQKAPKTGKLMKQVFDIYQYKKEVVEQHNAKFVVVLFSASWCRACQAVQPQIRLLAHHYTPEVKFVQAPLSKDTAQLFQGLGVEKFPFIHLYHSTAGLVEEQKISKKSIREFHTLLQTYMDGRCDVNYSEDSIRNFQSVPKK